MTIRTNCQTLKQVVRLINDEFSTDATSEMIAAAYAVESANAAGYGITDSTIDCALSCLSEAGARFDHHEAMKLAFLN